MQNIFKFFNQNVYFADIQIITKCVIKVFWKYLPNGLNIEIFLKCRTKDLILSYLYI